MTYQPLNIRAAGRPQGGYSSVMSPKGINLRDLPQLLDPAFAQNIENFLIDAGGQLKKRKGLSQILNVAGTNPVTMLEVFTDDIIMFGYADKLAAYTFSTNTVTTVHTFPAAGAASGVAVGDNFFVCNGSARIGYVNTSLVHALVTDTNAPAATVLYAAQARLFAGKDEIVYYSAIDDGSSVPFNAAGNWTAGTGADAANSVAYRNARNVLGITTLGQQLVVFYESGKAGFRITSIESGGTLVQDTIVDFQRIDFGGFRGAVYTQKGVFYANENGVWRMVSGGNTNQPYSERDEDISVIFGKEFFNDVDFSNTDLIHDVENNMILVTCAQSSSTNNLILWYNLDTGSFGKITGWNISRFASINATLYGASATSTTVYKLFDTDSDNGVPVRAEYTQELNLKDLTSIKSLENFYAQGLLSPSSAPVIYLDIYDQFGIYTAAKKTIEWNPGSSGDALGFGSAPLGSVGWGDSGSASGLVPDFAQTKNCRINTFLRIIVRIVVNDSLPMTLNWFSCIYKTKYPARTNNLTVTN